MSEKKHHYRVGDIVQVTARGKFHAQEVEILEVERTQGKWRSYQLAVKWGGTLRPSYFREDEFERVTGEVTK